MVETGGLAQTITEMATNKDYFRSEDGLGGAYQHPDNVSDDTIDAYLRPLTADSQRVADLERFILPFDKAQTVRIEEDLKKLTASTLIGRDGKPTRARRRAPSVATGLTRSTAGWTARAPCAGSRRATM